MAQHKQTAPEFIQSTFSPQVAVLTSNDAELLCQKNNLSFVQLVQPFCTLKTEAHIKDPSNAQHSIQGLRIGMVDMNSHMPTPAVAKKMMHDAVSNEQPQHNENSRRNVITVGDYDLQLNSTTPWFEAYRQCFLQNLQPSEHEFLKHCLACIFVVTSNHPDPLAMLQTLSSTQQQQQSQFPNKLPQWFCPNILKYYVILHDVVEADSAKAEAVYQTMKSTFGHQSCHLLQINSRSTTAIETMTPDTGLPDPWSQFLQKTPDTMEGVEYDGAASSGPEDVYPGKTEEALSHSNTADSVNGMSSSTSGSIMDHPLALNDESPATSPGFNDPGSYSGQTQTNINMSVSRSGERVAGHGHGLCLTASDQDRLRIFIHEFAVRALIPWAERQMRMLNDMLLSKTGFRKSIVGTAKKWFGGNPSKTSQVANTATTVVYSKDAPELQMRRLADLAFLFQLYEFAYSTYHTAKRDFNNDHAWLHFAGALEMAALAVFMQGDRGQGSYPDHYMESAITTYLQSCKNVPYAVRATLVSTEALKCRRKYKDAAMQFIKMMSEESDLRSALLLEQAAHCFINMKEPMVRKFSFHMILAGHRFTKAGQRKHALRSYSQALQIYKGKGWTLAEDHINFTIGRQSHNLKQLENATAAFKHLLTENSQQTPMQQNSFLREYLFVYKQLLVQETEETGLQPNSLPELPLPAIDCNATNVILGHRPQQPQEGKVHASGVWFGVGETNTSRWLRMEEMLVSAANGGSLPLVFRPALQLYTNHTDNKHSPVAYVTEPITVELHLVNPLKVALTLTDVMLLWSFLPTIASQDKPQLISNEHMVTAKNSLVDEIIHGQVVKEIVLQGSDRLPVQITLTPQQQGELRIYGLTYNLGSAATTFMAPSQGPDNPLGGSISGPTKASYVSTVFVRGKQKMEVQGPRLNSKKEEMVNKMYGPDRRLDLIVHQQMPILQVSFVNFPKTLLCGEVHPVTLILTNNGSIPLQKVKVATSSPGNVVFGGIVDKQDFTVYNTMPTDANTSGSANGGEGCDSVNCDIKLKHVVDLEIPNECLQPGTSTVLPLWIRGNDIGGIHELDFLFYYEATSQTSKSRYRLVRHHAQVNTIESLSIRAAAQQACRHSNNSANIGDMLISCEIENLSQPSSRSHVREMCIRQISCASHRWTMDLLSQHPNTGLGVGCRELLQVCLKARLLPESSRTGTTFTDIPLQTTNKIASCRGPCVDFYQRSQVKLGLPEENIPTAPSTSGYIPPEAPASLHEGLECANKLGITLVIVWQAQVIEGSDQQRTCVGQHHVIVEKPDNIFTSFPFLSVPVEPQALQFVKDDTAVEEKKPAFELVTRLVSHFLKHPTHLTHCFKKVRTCTSRVEVVIQNNCDADVTVLIDTSKAQLRLSELQEGSPVSENSCTGFSWVSQTQTRIRLSARKVHTLPLLVMFSRPGVYNINNLAVFVAYTDDHSEMTLQRQAKPSVITIDNIDIDST